MNFSELIESGRDAGPNILAFDIPADWMQGRTTYGGLTAALCLRASLALAEDKPVRSAQIAFIGPVSGTVTCEATLLREGKNSAFINVRVTGETGIAADALLAFGKARDSSLSFSRVPAPDVTVPAETPDFFNTGFNRPNFTRQFEMRLADGMRPLSGAEDPEVVLWMKHKDDALKPDAVSVLALADAPPPAAMSMLNKPAPISSMTWMAEFLTDSFATEDGWFLAHHIAEQARDGYSSQAMTLWNHAGTPVMIGRQTVTIFA